MNKDRPTCTVLTFVWDGEGEGLGGGGGGGGGRRVLKST